jgi:hypothetical protein
MSILNREDGILKPREWDGCPTPKARVKREGGMGVSWRCLMHDRHRTHPENRDGYPSRKSGWVSLEGGRDLKPRKWDVNR